MSNQTPPEYNRLLSMLEDWADQYDEYGTFDDFILALAAAEVVYIAETRIQPKNFDVIMEIQDVLNDESDIEPSILGPYIEERILPTLIVIDHLYPSELISEEDYFEFVVDEYDMH